MSRARYNAGITLRPFALIHLHRVVSGELPVDFRRMLTAIAKVEAEISGTMERRGGGPWHIRIAVWKNFFDLEYHFIRSKPELAFMVAALHLSELLDWLKSTDRPLTPEHVAYFWNHRPNGDEYTSRVVKAFDELAPPTT